MIEARIFTDDLIGARALLAETRAECRGEYEIDDTIYAPTDPDLSLAAEFLRLRVMPMNIWAGKSVILAVKRTIPLAVGKVSAIPIELQFDAVAEAERYRQQYLAREYQWDFSFSRTGQQHFLPTGDVVDLEVIEGHPSIEFKSATVPGMERLLAMFAVQSDDIIRGPSVSAVKAILADNHQ